MFRILFDKYNTINSHNFFVATCVFFFVATGFFSFVATSLFSFIASCFFSCCFFSCCFFYGLFIFLDAFLGPTFYSAYYYYLLSLKWLISDCLIYFISTGFTTGFSLAFPFLPAFLSCEIFL